MTQKRIIKLAFCLLTSIAGIGAYLYACGWFPPDWYVTNSAFSPELLYLREYTTVCFTA